MSQVSDEQTIVIVVTADSTFALPMTVTLSSALHHLPPEPQVHVYVVDDGISQADRGRCVGIVTRAHPRVTLDWVQANATQFEGFRTSAQYSRAVYLRLLLPEIVADRYERVLFIDSDVVVIRNLWELWSRDLGAYAYWAVENFATPELSRALPTLFPLLDAPADARYHNAGVLLVNMPQWREQRISEQALAFLRQYGGRLRYGDQDALNAVVKGRWGELNPIWNVQLLSLQDFQKSAPNRLQLQEDLLASAGILHYSGLRKPWLWRYRGRGERAYFRALLASGWFGPLQRRLWIAGLTLSHAAVRALALPKKIALGKGNGKAKTF